MPTRRSAPRARIPGRGTAPTRMARSNLSRPRRRVRASARSMAGAKASGARMVAPSPPKTYASSVPPAALIAAMMQAAPIMLTALYRPCWELATSQQQRRQSSGTGAKCSGSATSEKRVKDGKFAMKSAPAIVALKTITKNGSPRPSGGSVDSAAGEGDASEPTLDLGFAARKLGQISRSLICLTGHTRADPSTPDRCGDPFHDIPDSRRPHARRPTRSRVRPA